MKDIACDVFNIKLKPPQQLTHKVLSNGIDEYDASLDSETGGGATSKGSIHSKNLTVYMIKDQFFFLK